MPESGSTHWSTTLDIANTLNVEATSTEKLLLDYESYNLRLDWLYAINSDWALKIELPLIHYGGGFLDNSIDSWHDFFGLPKANRPHVQDDHYLIYYEHNGQRLIDLNRSASSIGDLQLALATNIIKQDTQALSFWFGIDLPTGDADNLIGNDSSDISLWLASEHRLAENWQLDSNLGVLFPGEDQLTVLEADDQVYFAVLGVEWHVHKLVDLRVQLDAHGQFYRNSQLELLGSAYSMVFGGRIHISDCSDLDLAFSEDVQVGATPDVSFLATWRSRGDCK